MPISPGIFKIRINRSSELYLDADAGKNGEIVTLNRIGSRVSDNKWEVLPVQIAGPIVSSEWFTIRNVKFANYFLDADFTDTGNNNCKVQLWKRWTLPVVGNPFGTNQIWKIDKLHGSTFRVSNGADDKMKLSVRNRVPDEHVKLHRISASRTQAWVFERV